MAESLAVRDWDQTQLNTMKKARKYVQALLQTAPKDIFGRSSVIVDPMTILQTGMVQDVERLVDDPPVDCLMPVTLYEGIQTIYGTPIWEKLDNEPLEYYELFKRYRSLQDITTTRSVFKLAVESAVPTKNLEVLRQVYQWQERCAAWDDYLQRERDIQLELRRREIEGRHASTAESLFKLASQYLTEHENLITPKIALQMLELAIKLERVSAGMALEPRRGSYDRDIAVNIQNNVAGQSGVQISEGQPTPGTEGSATDAKDRLSKVLNVMSQLNLLQPGTEVETSDIVEVEVNE